MYCLETKLTQPPLTTEQLVSIIVFVRHHGQQTVENVIFKCAKIKLTLFKEEFKEELNFFDLGIFVSLRLR